METYIGETLCLFWIMSVGGSVCMLGICMDIVNRKDKILLYYIDISRVIMLVRDKISTSLSMLINDIACTNVND